MRRRPRRRFRGRSLRARLATSHAVLALGLVALAAARLEATSVALRRAEAATGTQRDAEVLAARAARALTSPAELARLVADESRGRREVTVVGADGAVLAGSGTVRPGIPLPPAAVADGLAGAAGVDIEGTSALGYAPLVVGNELVGVAVVSEPVPPARPVMGPLRLEVGFGVALIVLAGLGGWWLAGRIVRPLRDLTVAAHRLALGNLSDAGLPRPPIREIATVSAAFERLSRRLARLSEERAGRERRQQEALRRLAHNLRTPLSVLALRLDEVSDPTIGADRRQELAPVLNRQLDALTDATHHLGELARTNGEEAPPEAVDMAEALEQAVERLEPLAGWSRLTVRVERPREPLVVHGERAGLADAVANLLENAVKFTPPGGRVVARCRRQGDEAVIEVADTGPGIPAEERALVVRPGVRGTTGAGVPGTGLGLALAAEAVAAGGGHLELSDARGGGLLARLVLPAAEGDGR